MYSMPNGEQEQDPEGEASGGESGEWHSDGERDEESDDPSDKEEVDSPPRRERWSKLTHDPASARDKATVQTGQSSKRPRTSSPAPTEKAPNVATSGTSAYKNKNEDMEDAVTSNPAPLNVIDLPDDEEDEPQRPLGRRNRKTSAGKTPQSTPVAEPIQLNFGLELAKTNLQKAKDEAAEFCQNFEEETGRVETSLDPIHSPVRDEAAMNRHCDIQLSDAEINESTKKLLNEPMKECSKTGLGPFSTFNKPPAAGSPFWKKKPQDKLAQLARNKTKAKKPAKKKTIEPLGSNIDDDHDDGETTLRPAVQETRRGHAKPSKKAKLNKPIDDVNQSEPEKQQSKPSNPIAEDTLDDPPPQDHGVSPDDMDVEPAISKPPSPIKPTEENSDDVVVTGFGFTTLGQPTVLSKHSAKEEISAEGKWKVDSESYTRFNSQDIHSSYLNRLYTSRDFEAGLVNLMKERYEVELSEKDSQLNDLKANIKTQQSKTSKAKSELKTALGNIEQLKLNFNTKKDGWEIEKAALLKRAEEAEAMLKSVTEELSHLKK
nr:muscle M-line assembly protein unc-89-like [Aegilops tauschii subsp. strangulata]